MKIRYTCTLDDYITEQMFSLEQMPHLKKTDRKTTIRGIGFLICFGIILNSFFGGVDFFVDWIPIGGLILVWLYLRRPGRHQKLIYRRLKMISAPRFKDDSDKTIRWEVNDDGIIINDAHKSVCYRWEQIIKITLAPQMAVVHAGEIDFAALPAKPFIEGDYASFHRYLLEMYQTKSEQLGKGNRIESSVWQINPTELDRKGLGRFTFKKAACWLLVVLIGMWFLYYTSGRRAVEKKVNALARAGYPVTMEALERQYVLPDGVENAADIYLKAFEAYQEPPESDLALLPTVGGYVLPDDERMYPQEAMDAIKTYLNNNEKTLALLDKAAKIEHCLMPRSFDFNNPTSYSIQTHNAIRLLCVRNLYLAQMQQADELFDSFQKTIQMTEILKQQPRMIDLYTTISMNSLAAANIEDILNLITLPEEQLILIQEQFSAKNNSVMLLQTLINEPCGTIEFYCKPLREKLGYYSGIEPGDKTKLIFSSLSGLYTHNINQSLDDIIQLVDIVQLRPYERFDYYKQRQKEAEESRLNLSFVHSFQGYHHVLRIDLRMQANLDCTKTALAVDRYRLAEGTLPEALEALVPEYLESVPVDPFDGKALKYLIHPEGGFSVYSIDDDGIDNNGVDRDQMKKKGKRDQGDIVFTINR